MVARHQPTVLLVLLAVVITGACGAGKPRVAPAAGGKKAPWIRNIEISGNRQVSDRAIRSGLASEDRSLLGSNRSRVNTYLLERDRARIESFYQHRGFFAARVVDVVIRKVGRRHADVRFVVVEGRPVEYP